MTRVLFATAELAPLTRVGGLGEASTGLVRELRALGVDVEVVLPDYAGAPLTEEQTQPLAVPPWAGPARTRSGLVAGFGRITLVEAPGLRRPHPYNNPASGEGWPDNTARFFAFSAAVAALAGRARPDVLHLNDWHTAPALGMVEAGTRSLLTIHNLAYQGADARSWLERLPRAGAFERDGGCNPLAGGITLADRVVAVSPTYAREIVEPAGGFGLDGLLRSRGAALSGIRNGIDIATWDPGTDPHLPARFSAGRLDGKARCRAVLLDWLGWPDTGGPLAVMVTRLTAQKGIDLALAATPALAGGGGRLVVLGSGDRALAERTRRLAASQPDVIRFVEGFDDPLGHLLFAGGDLLLMPSRFEPCGLTQMQAMAYGTIPVVTPVGGLLDTVIDADRGAGANGFVASAVDGAALALALRRAIAAWHDHRRRHALQLAGMSEDWSWRIPARAYRALYEEAVRAD